MSGRGFDAFRTAEKEYQDEVARLSKIAVAVVGGDRGAFVRSLADAWLRADPSNKRILKMPWWNIVTKYRLEEDLDE